MNKICTSIEQSQKLIVGIDIKTADMCWSIDIPDLPTLLAYPITDCDNWENKIPAWSLSALLDLIPPYLGEFKDGIDFGFSKSVNGKWYSAHYIQLDNSGLATFTKTVTGDTAIDSAFEMVCWLKENKKL